MTITNIEQQQRHPERVNLYLDGAFAFGLHKELLQKFGIRKGATVTPHVLKAIQSAEEITLAKQKALRYLSYRMRTEKEMRVKLTEKEFPPDVIDAVIGQLKSLRLIDDREFANTYVRDAQVRKPTGRRLLSQKLWLKGVPRETIEQSLAEGLDSGELLESAVKAAEKLVRRLASGRTTLDQEKQRQKVAQFLARRGFDWPTVSEVLKRLFRSGSRSSMEESE
jgi:regulatory protein